MDIEELKKRAQRQPERLSKAEWTERNKIMFAVPKKDFTDEKPQHKPVPKQKKERWQW
ncbi:MAG: hypothetical protein H8D26_04705 [Methanomicrobia archaeon]|nr:hypothetical protein [Methanomicrobia archaeon]